VTPPRDESDERTAVTVTEDVTYAERDAGELKLDLYVPDADAPPLVVYVHGGGWIAETRDNVPDPARYAAELGCAIASVSYRLAAVPDGLVDETGEMIDPDNPTPRGRFPDQFVDVKAAIRWLRANADDYGYDATRVAAWGASAGGHLALLAGLVDDVTALAGDGVPASDLEQTVAPEASGAVQAVVDWYGPTDLTLTPDDPATPESILLGGPRSEREAAFERASPLTHVSEASPPTLVVHGREDTVVSVEHSRLLFDALDEHGVDTVLYELHDLGHVWTSDGPEAIESERVAMDLLAATPTPAQTIRETTHVSEGETAEALVEGVPPAGPVPIRQFLDRTIG